MYSWHRDQRTTGPTGIRARGFTLVEMLLTMVIVSILMIVLVQVISSTESVWSREQARVSEFEEARGAMESMSRRLAEANMDAYWAFGKDTTGRDNYTRASDGHFVSGPSAGLLARSELPGHAVFFQGPFGHTGDSAVTKAPTAHLERMDGLLNCLGYYVDYQSDLATRPAFLDSAAQRMINPERRRFCLMEFRQPAEELVLFSSALALNDSATTRDKAFAWFRGPFADGKTTAASSTVVAENILAIILAPEWLETDIAKNTTVSRPVEDCYYDTREVQWGGASKKAIATQHQLPPVVRVTMIATEEDAYRSLETKRGEAGAADAVREVFKDRFKLHANLEGDLAAVEQQLTALKLDHRVFSTTIALRGSKWIIEKTL